MKLQKILLSTIGISGVFLTTTSSVLINNNLSLNSTEKQEKINLLEKDIKLNSTILNNETIYHYNDQEYRNEESIINSELEKNPILEEITSSNPNKIIKNYATNELDGEKIYSTNTDDMVLVYKNALGKTVLPNCLPNQNSGCYNVNFAKNENEKTQKDRALDSYVNPGLIRPKYTYDVSDQWYDSVEEAKMNYKKSDYEIGKGLFYYYDGNYYNAFNKNDEHLLKEKLTDAYTYDAFGKDALVGKMHGSMLEKPFSYEKKYFEEYFENEFKEYIKKYIDEVLEMTISYSFEITTGWDDQWFTDVYIAPEYKDNLKIELLNNNKTLKFIIDDNFRKNVNLLELLKNLKIKNNYKLEVIQGGCHNADRKQIGKFYYTDSEGKTLFNFTLDRTEDNACAGGYPEINPEHIKINTDGINRNKVNFKFLNTNPFFNKIDTFAPINKLVNSNSLINEFLAIGNYSQDIEVISDLASKQIKNIDNDFIDVIADHIYQNLYPYLFNQSKNNPIKSDKVYGATIDYENKIYKYTFSKENENFRKNNILNEKNKNLKDDDILSLEFLDGKFDTEYKNWKNNFYYLENDLNNSGVPLRIMYYVDSKKENSLTQFSNSFGDLITSNYQKAKNIAFDNSLTILKKAYEVYDINGKKYFTRESEENAIVDLKKQVKLEYKYINKKEANLLKDQEKEYSALITDGRYTVYKFKATNGRIMYFKDYNSALEIYKNQISLIGGITEENRFKKLYSIMINGELNSFEWDNNTNLTQLATQIYNKIEN